MLQEILALTTVVVAASYAGYSLYKSVCSNPAGKSGSCAGCASGGSCQLKELTNHGKVGK